MQVWEQAGKLQKSADQACRSSNMQAGVPARCKLLVIRAAVDACDVFGVKLDQAFNTLQTVCDLLHLGQERCGNGQMQPLR